MGENVEYILEDEKVLVVHHDQFDGNGYPLVVEIDYDEYNRLQGE